MLEYEFPPDLGELRQAMRKPTASFAYGRCTALGPPTSEAGCSTILPLDNDLSILLSVWTVVGGGKWRFDVWK